MTGSTKNLLVATRNAGKLKELSSLLEGVPFSLVSPSDLGIEDDVEETGTTLEENATLKAITYAGLSGLLTLADDSGLEVDVLGGEPGVRSSRYAGEVADDSQRIAHLLQKLRDTGTPEKSWNARFRCVIAIAQPLRQAIQPPSVQAQGRLSKTVELYAGECHGRIIPQPRGSNGFGYDPVFLLPEFGKTMAELSSEEKNRISHRSSAARKAAVALKRNAV